MAQCYGIVTYIVEIVFHKIFMAKLVFETMREHMNVFIMYNNNTPCLIIKRMTKYVWYTSYFRAGFSNFFRNGRYLHPVAKVMFYILKRKYL